jgi:hypothetical protein
MLFHESILFLFSKGNRAKGEPVRPERGRRSSLFVFSVFEERRVQMSGRHRGPLPSFQSQTSSLSPPLGRRGGRYIARGVWILD